jgi:hypothetical protein
MKTMIHDERLQGNGPGWMRPGRRILMKGCTFRMPASGTGCSVLCLTGMLWVTREYDPGDHILGKGSSWAADGPGLVVVEALQDSEFLILRPVPASLETVREKEAV